MQAGDAARPVAGPQLISCETLLEEASQAAMNQIGVNEHPPCFQCRGLKLRGTEARARSFSIDLGNTLTVEPGR